MIMDKLSILSSSQSANFVETDYIKELTERGLSYIRSGFPLHLSGPAGVGKTTLAFHIADKIGRPLILIYGDDEFRTSDLVGGQYGYHKSKVIDNYIHSVMKTEENMHQEWVDNRLTVACRNGFTLIYDEFTRSRPEANNILLSVLEEGLLPLPAGQSQENYLKVHPDFTAICTSNPEEYAGVHKSQDALLDRMVTMKLGHFDRETEIAITQAKSGVSRKDAVRIVDLARKARNAKADGLTPTIRSCIIIAKVLKLRNGRAEEKDRAFKQVCIDVLTSEDHGGERDRISKMVKKIIKEYK